jgi:hypothetical protein
MKFLTIDLAEGRSRPALRPEERLLLAVVDSAYWDLQSPDPIRRRTATQYFLDEDEHHTFSFVAICQHFSWSPASIRMQLGSLLAPLPEPVQPRYVNGSGSGNGHLNGRRLPGMHLR